MVCRGYTLQLEKSTLIQFAIPPPPPLSTSLPHLLMRTREGDTESGKCGQCSQSTYIQSTTVYVPASELGLSYSFSRQRVCPSPQNQRVGAAHSPAGEGLGESQFRRLEKSLAICLLCDQCYALALTLWFIKLNVNRSKTL